MKCAISPLEDLGATDCPVVIAPAPDYWVQGTDQVLLSCAPHVPHYIGQLLLVESHLLLAGLDDGLEAEWLPARCFPGVVGPNGKLSDGKAKEVEANLAIDLLQGMTNPGLARFQFQTHSLQPLLRDGLALS